MPKVTIKKVLVIKIPKWNIYFFCKLPKCRPLHFAALGCKLFSLFRNPALATTARFRELILSVPVIYLLRWYSFTRGGLVSSTSNSFHSIQPPYTLFESGHVSDIGSSMGLYNMGPGPADHPANLNLGHTRKRLASGGVKINHCIPLLPTSIGPCQKDFAISHFSHDTRDPTIAPISHFIRVHSLVNVRGIGAI
jgi:hypothetical protein